MQSITFDLPVDVLIVDPVYLDEAGRIWDLEGVDTPSGPNLQELGFTGFLWIPVSSEGWRPLFYFEHKVEWYLTNTSGICCVLKLDEVVKVFPHLDRTQLTPKLGAIIRGFSGRIEAAVDNQDSVVLTGIGVPSFIIKEEEPCNC